MRKKLRKQLKEQLNIALKLLYQYEKGKTNDRVKHLLDRWVPDTDDMAGLAADDEKSVEARERVRQNVFGYIYSGLRPHPMRVVWNHYRKYAAVAAIALVMGGTGWFALNRIEFPLYAMFADHRTIWQTEETGRMTVLLPDGSTVRINGGSRLEMDESLFNKQTREVWLSGEAFFNIARNPGKPFIVHTETLHTTVKGTSFNVKAYDELEETVVSVRTGEVEVGRNNSVFGVLTADMQLRFNKKHHHVQLATMDWRDAAGWIDGKIILNRAEAKELALRIKQHFGAEVIIEGHALAGKYVSGIFSAESSMEEMLSTISAVHHIHYEIIEGKVIITP
jgi:ferric-dicitrate binding protein FerR (iron transport regulator)